MCNIDIPKAAAPPPVQPKVQKPTEIAIDPERANLRSRSRRGINSLLIPLALSQPQTAPAGPSGLAIGAA
jgi:hypothetical protein